MKRKLLMTGILALVLVFVTETVHAQTVPLDTAINNVGDEFSYNLKKGSKAAILAIRSTSVRMSKYIIEELTSVLESQRLVTVVDRAQLDTLQTEMNYQITGEVSDKSAQAIGKRVGAQSVVTGSFDPVGNYYRFRVRVIDVETSSIIVAYSVNVQNDQAVASLMSGGGEKSAPASAAAPETAALQEDYEDFTTGQRWATWLLNAFTIPGLGSYVIMHDSGAGTFLLVSSLAAPLCIFLGSIAVTGDSSDETGTGLLLMGLGGGLYVVSFICNIVWSASTHKPRPETVSLADPTAWNIAVLPARNGRIDKVRLSYTMRFN